MAPQAREVGLLVEQSGAETVVYDTQAQHAHALPAEVAAVWRCCDGHQDVDLIARKLGLEPVAVEHALEQLARADLLTASPPASATRRQLIVRGARVGGVAVLGPLIVSSAIGPATAAASTPVTAAITITETNVGTTAPTYVVTPTPSNPSGSTGAVSTNYLSQVYFYSDGTVSGTYTSSQPSFAVQYGLSGSHYAITVTYYGATGAGNYMFSTSPDTGDSQSGTLNAPQATVSLLTASGASFTLNLTFA